MCLKVFSHPLHLTQCWAQPREADLTDGTDAARDMGREGGVVRRMEDGGRRFGRALAW